MSAYFDALCEAMKLVAQDPRAVFVGQAVESPGTAMYGTLRDVPQEKRLEFPVAEDFQMGFCTGLSLAGDLPICIYPRFNFLLLAVNQLVLHMDRMPLYSGWRPKVIMRTAIATKDPLDPGPQHLGEFTDAFHLILESVRVVRLDHARQIVPAYQAALDRPEPTLLIERTGLY